MAAPTRRSRDLAYGSEVVVATPGRLKEAERDKSAMPVVLVVGQGEVAVAVVVGVEVDVEGLEEVLAEVVTRNKGILINNQWLSICLCVRT